MSQLVAVAAFAAAGAGVYWWTGQNRPPTAPVATTAMTQATSSPSPPEDRDHDKDLESYAPPHSAYASAPADPRARTDRAMAEAYAKTLAAPGDPAPYVELTVAYVQKARETADAGYLSRAEAACLKSLQLRPGFYDAMQVLPWVYNTQHRFDEGAAAARLAQAKVPADAWNYGTLGDALLELGDYEGARKAYDTMADSRPDSASYARVARLRELLGDPAGAVAVMNDAVAASRFDHPEHYAWALTQRGSFRFNTGKPDEAAADYSAALAVFPDYHLALAGLAKAKAAGGKFDEAVSLYRKALDVAPYQETVVGLIDTLLHLGRDREAAPLFDLMDAVEKILRANHVKPGWLIVLFDADHDRDTAAALALAEQEAAARQDVRTMDALSSGALQDRPVRRRRRRGRKGPPTRHERRPLLLPRRHDRIEARPPGSGGRVPEDRAGLQPLLRRPPRARSEGGACRLGGYAAVAVSGRGACLATRAGSLISWHVRLARAVKIALNGRDARTTSDSPRLQTEPRHELASFDVPRPVR